MSSSWTLTSAAQSTIADGAVRSGSLSKHDGGESFYYSSRDGAVRCVNATSVAQRNNVNHDTSSMAQDFFYATGEPAETQPFCITSGEYEVESISGGGTCSGVESTSERSEIVRSDKYGGAVGWRRRISNSSVTMGCRCSSNTTRSDVQRNVGAEAE